jgi:ribosomal protein L20A (L18A)
MSKYLVKLLISSKVALSGEFPGVFIYTTPHEMLVEVDAQTPDEAAQYAFNNFGGQDKLTKVAAVYQQVEFTPPS